MKWRDGMVPLALLLAASGCHNQSAKQIIEGKLSRGLSHSASRAEVERYLQQERAEIFQPDPRSPGARFQNVKNDAVCRVDVSVVFIFDSQDRLWDHKSEEMRACL